MRNASRFLLPLEMFTAILLIFLGIDGWVGYSPLWAALASFDKNLEWGIALCGLGLVQLSVAFLEWHVGREWADRAIFRSVIARKWCGFLAVVAWLYVCYLMLIARGTDTPLMPALTAPVAVLFAAWICIGNLKVGCLLDPNVPTARLEAAMIVDRKKALGGR